MHEYLTTKFQDQDRDRILSSTPILHNLDLGKLPSAIWAYVNERYIPLISSTLGRPMKRVLALLLPHSMREEEARALITELLLKISHSQVAVRRSDLSSAIKNVGRLSPQPRVDWKREVSPKKFFPCAAMVQLKSVTMT